MNIFKSLFRKNAKTSDFPVVENSTDLPPSSVESSNKVPLSANSGTIFAPTSKLLPDSSQSPNATTIPDKNNQNDFSSNATILVAEDEQDLREILVEKMEESGFTTLEASDGEQCIELALSKHPDLILLDLYMPKSSGFDVIDKLINDKWGQIAKVIVLTNRGDFNSQRKVFELKHVSYLIKAETSLEQLVAEIKKKLNESYEDTLSSI